MFYVSCFREELFSFSHSLTQSSAGFVGSRNPDPSLGGSMNLSCPLVEVDFVCMFFVVFDLFPVFSLQFWTLVTPSYSRALAMHLRFSSFRARARSASCFWVLQGPEEPEKEAECASGSQALGGCDSAPGPGKIGHLGVKRFGVVAICRF